MKYCNITFFLLTMLVVSSCSTRQANLADNGKLLYKNDAPYLVVLSLDGFRWDYPEMYHTPNLDSLAVTGVKAGSLIPSFPSKTFPNHFTIATGLYPQNHGIVLNTFTDPEVGDYKLSDRNAVQNPEFYLGEPIWVTAEKQQLRTACFYWPGSEAPIQGIYPGIWKKYDDTVQFGARIDSIVSWLSKPVASRPHLIMGYFDEPDHTGHQYGPFADETKQVVESLDSLVGVFCSKLNSLPIADSINLVITSDHGMGQITAKKSIVLANYLNEDWVQRIRGGNPVIMLKPFDDYVDTVWHTLSSIPHLKVYSKNNMPTEFHYNLSKRILDYVCVADSGWAIYWKNTNFTDGGTHGYNPSNTDMHAIFYGSGPAFKSNFKSGSIQNIHLYSLFSKILGVEPTENDGSVDSVVQFLKEQ
ncbi:alkaline phosphatase family protein [Mangrovibacterium lignilyticum]|uniref:alkaline phosphatase family protein n=1 Tax=Mangrovibacterium lignilyticum TaxID=2668052 RepID=UPI0013D22B7C|nr:ectonucleotide pyrophosphatase/phosphodiesterase [Mangrovibacterium lignilyticum]